MKKIIIILLTIAFLLACNKVDNDVIRINGQVEGTPILESGD